MSELSVIPNQGERHLVADTLEEVRKQDFEQVVVLGFKNGKSYLHHSKIDNIALLVGAIEWLKYRLMEKG